MPFLGQGKTVAQEPWITWRPLICLDAAMRTSRVKEDPLRGERGTANHAPVALSITVPLSSDPQATEGQTPEAFRPTHLVMNPVPQSPCHGPCSPQTHPLLSWSHPPCHGSYSTAGAQTQRCGGAGLGHHRASLARSHCVHTSQVSRVRSAHIHRCHACAVHTSQVSRVRSAHITGVTRAQCPWKQANGALVLHPTPFNSLEVWCSW